MTQLLVGVCGGGEAQGSLRSQLPCGALLEVSMRQPVWIKTSRPVHIWGCQDSPGKTLGTSISGGVLLSGLLHQLDSLGWPMWVTPPIPMAESCPL